MHILRELGEVITHGVTVMPGPQLEEAVPLSDYLLENLESRVDMKTPAATITNTSHLLGE